MLAEAPGSRAGHSAALGVASFLLLMMHLMMYLLMLPRCPSRRRETGPSLCPTPGPSPKPDPLLTPPLGPLPLPSAPDRLRKGLVWAVRTGGPPAAATAAAAAAAAMRLVLLPSEGATRAPAGSRGGADAVGSRPGVPADSSGVELPASRLAMGNWEPPAICSRCSSRFCWICWIIW